MLRFLVPSYNISYLILSRFLVDSVFGWWVTVSSSFARKQVFTRCEFLGIAFGTEAGTNWFCGVGFWSVVCFLTFDFSGSAISGSQTQILTTTALYSAPLYFSECCMPASHPSDVNRIGKVSSPYPFRLSFATTATTIVSGIMAERTRLTSYMLFSFINTIVYVFPAHWVWGKYGFLKELGRFLHRTIQPSLLFRCHRHCWVWLCSSGRCNQRFGGHFDPETQNRPL